MTKQIRNLRASLVAICILASVTSCRRPIPAAPDREVIAATIAGFHNALGKGDGAAALAFLAPDAQILESGHRQTREEYESEHLAADIEFARVVPSTRGALIVRQEGNTAWATSTSVSKGQFRGRAVDAENAELMVLAKTDDGWRIRAIHWSSHSHGAAP